MKLSTSARILIALASLSMSAAFFLPVWAIYLVAPQYPEGLAMQIWLDHLSGQVEIINGLNHYIGMKHISEEMFPEFTYLTYVLGAFIAAGLVVAVIGKRKVLLALLVLMIIGASAALLDFYRWGYDYGHNLDPKAPIQVPGLSYQPPVLGHKKLLNFDAYSYPDSGGWVIIGAGALFFLIYLLEGMRNRKQNNTHTTGTIQPRSVPTAVAAALMLFFLASCSAKPQPIQYGKDGCDFCRMTIMDPHFGGEVVTKKGKVYKFDDLHCMAIFLKKGTVAEGDIAQTLAVVYGTEGKLIPAGTATFIRSEKLRSPMGSNTAAAENESAATPLKSAPSDRTVKWQTLLNEL